MKRGILIFAVIAAGALWTHRSGAHEVAVLAACALVGLLALLAVAAGAHRVAARLRPADRPARERLAPVARVVERRLPESRPAVSCVCGAEAGPLDIEGRPACGRCVADALASSRPADMDFTAGAGPAGVTVTCGSCSSRPAVTDRAGWELCGQCASRVDAAAGHARQVAEAHLARPAFAEDSTGWTDPVLSDYEEELS